MSDPEMNDLTNRDEVGTFRDFIVENEEQGKTSYRLVLAFGAAKNRPEPARTSDLGILLQYLLQKMSGDEDLREMGISPTTYVISYDSSYTSESVGQEVTENNVWLQEEAGHELARVVNRWFAEPDFPIVYSLGPNCYILFVNSKLRSLCLEGRVPGEWTRDIQASIKRMGFQRVIDLCNGRLPNRPRENADHSRKGLAYQALERLAHLFSEVYIYNSAWENSREMDRFEQVNMLFEKIPETLVIARATNGFLLFRKEYFPGLSLTGQRSVVGDDLQEVQITPETRFAEEISRGGKRRKTRKQKSKKRRTRKH